MRLYTCLYLSLKRTLNSQRYTESWLLCILWNSHFARIMSCMSIWFCRLIYYCSNWRSTVSQRLQNLKITRISRKRCHSTYFQVFISSLYLSLLPNFQQGRVGVGWGGGGLDRISIFRGGLLGKTGVTFSRGLQFLYKK